MSGFNTKERNNNGEYEITFYTDNHEDFKTVETLCRNLIGHGKPVINEGDLISRLELKKAIEQGEGFSWDSLGKDDLCVRKKYIDNVPTVEPFEPDYVGAERLKARQRGYEEGYHNGMKIGKTLNPKIKHGEWNYIQAGMCVCPFCGAMPHKLYKNYCAKCGAELKGGAE